MSKTSDLPKLAWTVLAAIRTGTPLSSPKQISWAEAFRQIRWVVTRNGALSLTEDGEAALRECHGAGGHPSAED
jgi:hypothetical protein